MGRQSTSDFVGLKHAHPAGGPIALRICQPFCAKYMSKYNNGISTSQLPNG